MLCRANPYSAFGGVGDLGEHLAPADVAIPLADAIDERGMAAPWATLTPFPGTLPADIRREGPRVTVQLEHKSVAVSATAALDDDPVGTVRCLVAVTGIRDNVDDVIMPGAFARTIAIGEDLETPADGEDLEGMHTPACQRGFPAS